MDIKKLKSSQVMTWEKAKDMLIPEAHTFWIILKCFVAKLCANYCTNIYFAKNKRLSFWKTIKLYLWAVVNWFLRIDVEPYLKKSITNKEIK